MAKVIKKIEHGSDTILVPRSKPIKCSRELYSTQWNNNTQTRLFEGVSADNDVIVSPDPSSFDDYCNAGIRCTGQGNNTLTFTCNVVPTNHIMINVIILD